MPLTLPVIPSNLPQGFCPDSYQTMWNEFAAHGAISIPDGSLGGVQVSASKPADQLRPWLKLDSSGNIERLYWFSGGVWLSRHPLVPGMTLWWFDVLPTFSTFDGGDTLDLSLTTGPMWRQALLPNGIAIAAQFPLVAGTLPSGLVRTLGDTGGEENHVLTQAELPTAQSTLTSTLPGWRAQLEAGVPQWIAPAAPGQSSPTTPSSAEGTFGLTNTGGGQGHNTMPPYVVGYLLQRTRRAFYVVP